MLNPKSRYRGGFDIEFTGKPCAETLFRGVEGIDLCELKAGGASGLVNFLYKSIYSECLNER